MLRILIIGVRTGRLVNARPASPLCISFDLEGPIARSRPSPSWVDCITSIGVLHDGLYYCGPSRQRKPRAAADAAGGRYKSATNRQPWAARRSEARARPVLALPQANPGRLAPARRRRRVTTDAQPGCAGWEPPVLAAVSIFCHTGFWWFTEGFDTLDLKEAKALLDELT